MQELRDAGLVGGTLQDPAGFPYVMGPNGVPQLDPQSTIVLDSRPGARTNSANTTDYS